MMMTNRKDRAPIKSVGAEKRPWYLFGLQWWELGILLVESLLIIITILYFTGWYVPL
ncbi:MAG: hypothetical protein ACLFTH_01345 [Candidatus Woesearchaeota archaeon]